MPEAVCEAGAMWGAGLKNGLVAAWRLADEAS